MAGRQARKSGGKASFYDGGNSKVAKAFERKDGGKACAMPAGKSMKRARGGRTGSGSDTSPMAPGSAKHPFSSAHRK